MTAGASAASSKPAAADGKPSAGGPSRARLLQQALSRDAGAASAQHAGGVPPPPGGVAIKERKFGNGDRYLGGWLSGLVSGAPLRGERACLPQQGSSARHTKAHPRRRGVGAPTAQHLRRLAVVGRAHARQRACCKSQSHSSQWGTPALVPHAASVAHRSLCVSCVVVPPRVPHHTTTHTSA
jgi:hypothetical protein